GETCLSDCSACAVQCGDQLLGPGESCEPYGCDRNGCRSNVGCPAGESCLPDCSACAARCGDGLLGPGEAGETSARQCEASGCRDAGCRAGESCLADCSACAQIPTCPSNAAGGPTSMAFVVQGPGSDLDIGWTGELHGFPVTPNATVILCLSGCDGGADPVCDAAGASGTGTLNGEVFGSPVPLLTAGVPLCLVNRFRGDITGAAANEQTGDVSVVIPLLSGVYVTRTDQVCPRCVGGACDSGS